jgi:hypothetical protein
MAVESADSDYSGIALRGVNHPWHGLSVVVFWALVVLGCATSGLYAKLTPNMCVTHVLRTYSC